MTARNYTKNGFFWTGVEGYRGSYLTTYRIGDYGLYAFDSTSGLLEHSYAPGSPDAGFYIGQCYPCDAVIDDVIAEYNGLGYSGTNSGGDLYIVNSTFRFNRAGIVPNSGSYELCYPGRSTTIVGNLVYSNNQPDTPAIDVALLAMGNGISPAGGVGNVIERNRCGTTTAPASASCRSRRRTPTTSRPRRRTTRSCAPSPARRPRPTPPTSPSSWCGTRGRTGWSTTWSRIGWPTSPSGRSRTAELGNCFAGNTFATSAPLDVEALAPCEGEGSGGDWSAGALDLLALMTAVQPPSGDYKATPVPGPQPTMPDAESAPARPATDLPQAGRGRHRGPGRP